MPGAFELVATLDPVRENGGTLELKVNGHVVDTFPVWGVADATDAAQKGNPSRSELKSFGNTPTGVYRVERLINTAPGTTHGDTRTSSGLLSYGHQGALVLTPISGNAAK